MSDVVEKSAADEAERQMLDMPQVDCPLVHHFGPGIYLREVTIPEGTLVVGHSHRFPHMCILMAGTLRVLDSEGDVRDFTAPAIFTAPVGRKVLYAVEGDCVFQNVFATDETDVDRLEARLVDKSPAFLAAEEARMLGVTA